MFVCFGEYVGFISGFISGSVLGLYEDLFRDYFWICIRKRTETENMIRFGNRVGTVLRSVSGSMSVPFRDQYVRSVTRPFFDLFWETDQDRFWFISESEQGLFRNDFSYKIMIKNKF